MSDLVRTWRIYPSGVCVGTEIIRRMPGTSNYADGGNEVLICPTCGNAWAKGTVEFPENYTATKDFYARNAYCIHHGSASFIPRVMMYAWSTEQIVDRFSKTILIHEILNAPELQDGRV